MALLYSFMGYKETKQITTIKTKPLEYASKIIIIKGVNSKLQIEGVNLCVMITEKFGVGANMTTTVDKARHCIIKTYRVLQKCSY